jgi:hypothetical protein
MPAIKVGEEILTNLFTQDLEPGAVRSLVRHVGTDLLLGSSKSRRSLMASLHSAIDSGLCNARNTKPFENLIEATPLTTSVDKELESKRIRRLEIENLKDLFENEMWQDEVATKSPLLKPKDRVEEFFGNYFGHLIKAAIVEFEIIDKYFLAKILNKDHLVEFLFREFATRKLPRLKIRTSSQANGNFNSMRVQERATSAAVALAKLSESVGLRSSIELQVYSEFQHNRYFVTRFSGGLFAFELGMGVDMFSNSQATEGQKINLLTEREWADITGNGGLLAPSEKKLQSVPLAMDCNFLELKVA